MTPQYSPSRFAKPFASASHGRSLSPATTIVLAPRVLNQGYADLVAFGRPFVANPDLPARLEHNLPLAPLDHATLFGGNATGYSDYPVISGEETTRTY